jgi:hypothetical protein
MKMESYLGIYTQPRSFLENFLEFIRVHVRLLFGGSTLATISIPQEGLSSHTHESSQYTDPLMSPSRDPCSYQG